MDGDAPQPSTSHSSEAKDPTRSKLDRLVKKVGRKLLPKSGENIFVPSTMSPCLARTSQSPSTDESQHSLCGDAGSRTSAATNVGVPLPGLFINTFGTEAAGSGYGWLTAPDTPEPYHGVASILRGPYARFSPTFEWAGQGEKPASWSTGYTDRLQSYGVARKILLSPSKLAQQIGLEMVKERIRWTKQQIDTCRRDEQMIADFVADAFVDELHATSNKQKYYQVLEDIKHLENEIDELRKLSPRIVPPPRPAPPFHQSTWYCIRCLEPNSSSSFRCKCSFPRLAIDPREASRCNCSHCSQALADRMFVSPTPGDGDWLLVNKLNLNGNVDR